MSGEQELQNQSTSQIQDQSFPPSDDDFLDVEKKAAEALSDPFHLSRAVFRDEGRATKYWLLFLTVYWTCIVWINTAATFELSNSALAMWCVAAVGLLGGWYLHKEGKYPSGSTKENPNETSSSGRYSAIYLNVVMSIDVCYLTYEGIQKGFSIPDIVLSCCHVIGLVWGTLFYFNRFRRQNPDVATTAFVSEWLDIAIAYIVIFILHSALDETTNVNKGCFKQAICIVYFSFMVCKLIGWVFPMVILRGWGTENNAKSVCTHLFILGLLTDLPVIITVLIEESYKVHAIIFIDIMWKTCLLIRSSAYYIIYNLWLEKGNKIFESTKEPLKQ